MMDTLLDMDTIPVVEPDEAPKKPKAEYYIRAMSHGKWFFLWKTHTNGGGEWRDETELTVNGGRMKPLRYKTFSGAKRMIPVYVSNDVPKEVAVWEDTK